MTSFGMRASWRWCTWVRCTASCACTGAPPLANHTSSHALQCQADNSCLFVLGAFVLDEAALHRKLERILR